MRIWYETKIVEDRGDIKVVYSSVEEEDYQEIGEIFQETEIFGAIAAELNNTLILPNDITVNFQ